MITYKDELYHHGIKGQKWGVRRFQYADGSLTSAGQKRYNKIERKFNKKIAKSEKEDAKVMALRAKNREKIASKYDKKIGRIQRDIRSYDDVKDGLKDTKGRQIFTADDVKNAVNALQSKIDKLSGKRDAKLKDFDAGTKYVKAGQDAYNNVLKKYKDVQLKSLSSYGFNKSAEYEDAKKNYKTQRRNDNLYGTGYTKLAYAQISARNDRHG